MEPPSVAQFRVPIIVAIAIGEIAGLAYFYQKSLLHPSYGTRALIGFLMLSLMGIALIVPYLWSDWLLRHQINYFEIAAVVILGPSAIREFNMGSIFKGALDAVICLIFLIAMLPALLGHPELDIRRSVHQKSAPRESKKESEISQTSGGKYFGMLVVWLICIALVLRMNMPVPFWIEIAILLPAVWLVWLSFIAFRSRLTEVRHKNATAHKTEHQEDLS